MFHDFSEVNMTRGQMIGFVEDQLKKGLERVDAIRNLAFYIGEDDPGEFSEKWFQELIGGE